MNLHYSNDEEIGEREGSVKMIFTRIATVHEVTKVTKETNKH